MFTIAITSIESLIAAMEGRLNELFQKVDQTFESQSTRINQLTINATAWRDQVPTIGQGSASRKTDVPRRLQLIMEKNRNFVTQRFAAVEDMGT